MDIYKQKVFISSEEINTAANAVCAVDSTTRSAYGDSLAGIRWGKNKEGVRLPQTSEVVVYSLDDHIPVYYRTFPGNIPDSRSVETLLTDLNHAGFPDIALLTDRGYESIQNLERYILAGQKMVMCVKVGQTFVLKHILEYGDFIGAPEQMSIDAATQVFFHQYDVDYRVKGNGDTVHKADRFRLNIYFDPVKRGEDVSDLMTEIELQRWALQAWELCRLRDGQEKYFEQMKTRLGYDRQRNWSEEGKTGRLFILFVGLILSSYVRHTWKSTFLHKQFSSTLEVLDEMRPIRCVEHTGKAKFITPFVGAQVDIANAFGFEIPEGCAPKFTSRKKSGTPVLLSHTQNGTCRARCFSGWSVQDCLLAELTTTFHFGNRVLQYLLPEYPPSHHPVGHTPLSPLNGNL